MSFSSAIEGLIDRRILINYRVDLEVLGKVLPSKISINSKDKMTRMVIDCENSETYSENSVFKSLHEVSDFFEKGSKGYSPARSEDNYHGIELVKETWKVSPLKVNNLESSFFLIPNYFRKGALNLITPF